MFGAFYTGSFYLGQTNYGLVSEEILAPVIADVSSPIDDITMVAIENKGFLDSIPTTATISISIPPTEITLGQDNEITFL